MAIPRIVVAGATSGVGKTTISLGMIHALRKKGYRVQPFKVGPDFIDPSYHTLVAGRPSRNLDVWLMGNRGVLETFTNACSGADLALIEGVMGLFDGLSGKSNFASTAHVARILKSPVILVVDAGKAARSIAALVKGFLQFDRDVKICGIILNNVAGDRHLEYLTDAISSSTRVPILGTIMRDSTVRMDERHLGLVPAHELADKKKQHILKSAREIADRIQIDNVLAACGTSRLPPTPARAEVPECTANIAVALDESFNFYYQDNLDALRRSGALLHYFSPVSDNGLPAGTDGIILGGGFPEVLANRLEQNAGMMRSIRKNIERGMPVYGECGGLMYLTRSIRGYMGSDKRCKMAGVIDADTVMTGKLTLNYTEADCHGPFFGKRILRGHEFHYSQLQNVGGDTKFAYDLRRGNGITRSKDGIVIGGTGLAAYTHLHFAERRLATGIVNACRAFSRR